MFVRNDPFSRFVGLFNPPSSYCWYLNFLHFLLATWYSESSESLYFYYVQYVVELSLMTPTCSTSSHVVPEDIHMIFMRWLFKSSDIWNNWLIVNLLWEFCMWSTHPFIAYVQCLHLSQMLPYVVCIFVSCGIFWRTDVCNFDEVWHILFYFMINIFCVWNIILYLTVTQPQRHCSPLSSRRVTEQQPFACTCLLILHSYFCLPPTSQQCTDPPTLTFWVALMPSLKNPLHCLCNLFILFISQSKILLLPFCVSLWTAFANHSHFS